MKREKLFSNLTVFVLVVLPMSGSRAFAESFQLRPRLGHQDVGAPANVTHWWIDIEILKQASLPPVSRAQIVLDVYSQSAKLSEVQVPLSQSQLANCLNSNVSTCDLGPVNLPIEDELLACKVQVSLQQPFSGDLAAAVSVPWGQCDPPVLPAGPNVDLRWDLMTGAQFQPLAFPIGTVFREPSESVQARLLDLGSASLTVPVGISAVGYDNKNQVIWNSMLTLAPPVSSQGGAQVMFADPVLAWQWHRLCQVQLDIDPKNVTLENQDAGRDGVFSAGLCETNAENDPANRPDLTAQMSWSGRTLSAQIVNIGKVSAPKPGSVAISYRFDLFDSASRSLGSMAGELRQEIQGYGDAATVSWLMSPVQGSGACKAVLTIDPSGHLVDSNPANNIITTDHCRKPAL